MPTFVSSVFPEQGNEFYMAKDREYFKQHPQAECYHRELFKGEPHNCPFPVPYIVVFNIGLGIAAEMLCVYGYLTKNLLFLAVTLTN